MVEQRPNSRVDTAEILERNARIFGVSKEQILDRGGKLSVRVARNRVCREMRDEGMSYLSIGEVLDGRDHTTIINDVRSDIFSQEHEEIVPSSEIPAIVDDYLKMNFDGVKIEDISRVTRTIDIRVPRQAVIRHLFYDKGITIVQIAEAIKRDHSTVANSISKPHEKMQKDIEKWKARRLAKTIALQKAKEVEQIRLEREKSKIKQEVFTDVTLQEVAKEYGVEREQIVSKSREKIFVQPRKTVQFMLHKGTDFSFQKIANAVGSIDHTSAIHAIDTVETRLEFDLEFRERLEELFGRINEITNQRSQELTP